MTVIERIVSGAQTGADRAALDWAIANRVPHGGWCPDGRFAEDVYLPCWPWRTFPQTIASKI
ncbi:MAG: hypothetical protein IPH73_04075 [Rhodocyclales bacterium]|nr:hypothetical protein [Rhodocyclales bacterium]